MTLFNDQNKRPGSVDLTFKQFWHTRSLSFHWSTKNGMKQQQPVNRQNTNAIIQTRPP
jgi:hypothetical protein